MCWRDNYLNQISVPVSRPVATGTSSQTSGFVAECGYIGLGVWDCMVVSGDFLVDVSRGR